MSEYLVQVGRYKSAYKTKWKFDNDTQAYTWYDALNIFNRYKKRILKDGKVIERYISHD